MEIKTHGNQKKSRLFWENTTHLGWLTLFFLLAVIAWGAFVRASGSGAGCGSHWPLCNGQVLPVSMNSKMAIEFTHRVTSGISLILCLGLGWSCFQRYPKGSFTRKAGMASMILIFLEALLGAGLVLLELVAENKSLFRTFSLGIHLMNTFFLIGAIVLTIRWSKEEIQKGPLHFLRIKSNLGLFTFSLLAIIGLLLLGSSGAMTALGDTLFPAVTVTDGLRQDFSSTSHFLVRLRIYHPTLAILVTCYMTYFAWFIRKKFGARLPEVSLLASLLATAQLSQVLLGIANILFLAPLAIQLSHLLLADVVWLLLIQTLACVWVVPISKTFTRMA